MSRASGQLTARSKASSRQGKIHTENPELLELLRENSADIKANRQFKKKSSSPTKGKKVGSDRSVDSKKKTTSGGSVLIKATKQSKKEDADSGHFEGEDFLISDSGDAKPPQSGRDTYIVSVAQKARKSDAAGDSMNVSNKENISGPNTGNIKRVSVNWDWDSEVYHKSEPGESVQASQEFSDEEAVEKNNSENVINEKSVEKKDSLEQDNGQFVLSDINESDRDTLGSSSSELARLRSPSRKSLNPDIEGSPVPSSPVHPPEKEDNSGGNNFEEDRESSSTPVGIDARAAGATPHPSSRRPVSRTPTPEATTPVGEVQGPEAETVAETEPEPAPAPAPKDPYDIYRNAAPSKVNDQKNSDTASNTNPAPERKDPYDLRRTTNNPDRVPDTKRTTDPPRKDPYNIYQTSTAPSKDSTSNSEQPKEDKPPSNTDTVHKGNIAPTAPEKAKTVTPTNAPPAEAVSTAAPVTAPVTNSPVPQAAAGGSPSPNKPGPAYSGGSPRQSKASLRPTPGPTETLTPRGNQTVTAVNPKLLENSIEDKSLQLEEASHPRFTAPYSSSRLKSRGDAAKRSASVATSSEIPYSPREGGEISKLVPDSLDIEKDSLEVDQEEKENRAQEESNAEEGFENRPEQKEAVEAHIQDAEQPAALSNPAESENRNDIVERNESNDKLISAVSEKPELARVEPEKQTIVTDSEKEPTAREEPQKQTISSNRENSRQDLKPQFQRERSHTEDTLRYDNSGAFSVNQQEQDLPPPAIDIDPVKAEEEPADHVEFVIKTDPYKQTSSRYSSAQGSGRFSNTLRRNSESTRGTPLVVGSAAKHSNRTTPSSKKVYVESPTFTREEEEEYRFVSSRLDDVEEEKADTYRELDMAAIQTREGYAPMAAPKMQTEKRVRYSDIEGRYEDRDSGMNGGGGEGPGYSKASRGYDDMNDNDDADEYGYGQPAGFQRQNDRYPEDPRNRREYEQQQAFQHQQPPQHPQQQLQQRQQQQPPQYGGGDGYGNRNPAGYGNQNSQPQMFGNPNQQGYSGPSQGYSQEPMQQGYNPNQQGFPNQQQQYGGYNHQQQQMQQQPDGYSRQFQQQQPPQPHGNVSNQPLYHQQQQQPFQPASQPPPAPPEQKKPPVRGLSLPTGPSYDPVDEEELIRETTYQQGLRMRIADGNRQAEETAIPNLPLNQDHGQGHPRFDSQDFVQDSLDNDPNEDTFRSYGSGLPQDSLEMYGRPPQHHHPQNHFRNPPALPQAFAGHNNNNQVQGSRLNNVNFDSEDYADYEDIRQPRVNPQVQPRFYNPQLDPQRGNVNNGAFADSGQTTERSEMDTFRNMQRYEDRNDNEEEEEPMEAVHPKPPKYDYVTHNKDDYGKQPPKSYKRIHEITKEEKDKLNDIFIQPKPKGKGGILKKKGQGQGRQGSQFSDLQPQGQYVEQDPAYEDMTPAEQMWAQRSASLAKKFDPNANKGRRKGPGGLQKFNSDSSLSQAPLPQRRDGYQPTPQQRQQQQQQQPQHPNQQQLMIQPQGGRVAQDKRAFITEMPTPVNEGGYQNQVAQPMSPRQAEIQLHPISQQIITEDGQRISVDVNLKLISPPPHIGGSPPQQQQQQHHPQQQYYPYQQQQQVPNHPPPQYYGGGRGRQYPAVTNYDEDGGGYGDYNPQEYDDSNEYRYISPRERYSADEALRALNDSRTEMNPYGKIPPIPRSSGSEHPSSAPIPDQGGSYMDMYIKQKVKDSEKPWYRVYGLKDYRKMQKEVRLGTLGPDLDSDAVKERKEKVARQNDYARVVMERNRNELSNRKPPSFPRPKEENDIMNRRKLAVEYAKSVPKPTVKIQPNEYNNYEMASEKSPIARHHRRDDDRSIPSSQKNLSPSPSQPRKKKEPEMDVLNLEKLRQRYEEDKQNEAIIRRNTGSAKGEKYY